MSPLIEIQNEISTLRQLRRKLCVYRAPHSDKFCDCKTLTGLPLYTVAEVKQAGGERTGCCEVRAAIAMLEMVEKSFHFVKAEVEENGVSEFFGVCHDCHCRLTSETVFEWVGKTISLTICADCNAKRLKLH